MKTIEVTPDDLKAWAKIAAGIPDEIKQKYRDADVAYAEYMEAAGVPASGAALLIAGWHERRCTQIVDAITLGMVQQPGEPVPAADEEE